MPEGTSESILELKRLGRRLKSARADAGFTNTTHVTALVARKYPGIGLAAVTLGRYERGETEPPLRVLLALSFVYDKPIDHFLRPSLRGDAARDYERLNRPV